MPRTSSQDVVIRSRATLDGTEFVVVCGSARPFGGPFRELTDALRFAESEVKDGSRRILYEAYDERGRAIGERLVLRAAGA
jgi:hypothetical protein